MSCCLSLLIVSMDATIVNVAIPAIRSDLGASTSQLQWVIDIYTLVLASLLMLSGAAGDRFGRRRVFQIGLAVFAAGSLLCSLAPGIEMLIAARFIQAIGGSMLNPVALSIISQVFTGRVERARALGFWGAVVGISMALGPTVGGLLIEVVGWRAVFWINLPICAGGDHPHRDLRTREQVGDDAQHRSRRSGARRDLPVRHGVHAHRRAGPGLDASAHRRGLSSSRCSRSSRSCATSPGAAIRSSTCASSAASRSPSATLDGDHRLRCLGRVPVHDVAVPAGRAGLLRDAHRIDLPADRRWRAAVLAAVGPAGRPVRWPPVAAGGRRADHRGVGDADVAHRDDAGVGAADRSSRSSASASRWSTRRSPTPPSAACRWTGPARHRR